MLFFHQNKRIRKTGKAGFTLVELLVTISIFVVLTGVVIVHQNTFDNTILLNNLAYDTALTIRQAQSYGVNTREVLSASGYTFASSTGVYFNISSPSGSATNFVLFADTVDGSGNQNPDQQYNGSVTSCPVTSPECLQKYSIKNSNFIQSLCVGSNASDCTAPNDKNHQVNNLTILFTRPNPDAVIEYVESSGNFIANSNNYAKITVSSADGSSLKSVVVTATGQIYVQ